MDFEDLKYNIQKRNPKFLLSNEEDLDVFFLKLALFFNDIKSCLILIFILIEKEKSETQKEVNSFFGELGGMTSMLEKTLVGYLNEFFDYLMTQEDLLGSYKFLLIIKDIQNDDLLSRRWQNICDLSFRNKDLDKKELEFRNKMTSYRNDYFHYKNNFIESYKKYFIDKDKEEIYNKDIFYNFGRSIKDTRFFYVDAIIKQKQLDFTKKVLDLKGKELINIVYEILEVVQYILKLYFNYLDKKPQK